MTIEARAISHQLDYLHLNGAGEAFDQLMVELTQKRFTGTHDELLGLWRRIREEAKALKREDSPNFQVVQAAIDHIIEENRRLIREAPRGPVKAGVDNRPKAASVGGAVSANVIVAKPMLRICGND